MANVTIRKDTENKPAQVVPAWESRWEPLRAMRDLMNWDPFREMSPFVSTGPATFVPAFEIKETNNSYVFKADVPGLKESDLAVSLTGNRLTVSGKREEERQEQNDNFYAYERAYGDFSRSFTLPEGIDSNAIFADLKDGVLTLTLNKKPEVQPKKIAIQTATKKS